MDKEVPVKVYKINQGKLHCKSQVHTEIQGHDFVYGHTVLSPLVLTEVNQYPTNERV